MLIAYSWFVCFLQSFFGNSNTIRIYAVNIYNGIYYTASIISYCIIYYHTNQEVVYFHIVSDVHKTIFPLYTLYPRSVLGISNLICFPISRMYLSTRLRLLHIGQLNSSSLSYIQFPYSFISHF